MMRIIYISITISNFFFEFKNQVSYPQVVVDAIQLLLVEILFVDGWMNE